MTHYHSVMHFHFSDSAFAVKQTPLESLREDLKIDLWCAANKAQNIPTAENVALVVELQEQMVIMDAIDFGYIKPLPVRKRRAYHEPLQRENADGSYTQEFDDFSDADPGL